MKCKFCGAEVKLGERCQYCGSVAEAFYYKPEEPPEVVGKNLTDQKEYTVQKGDSLWRIAQRFYGNGAACYALAHRNGIKNPDLIYPGAGIEDLGGKEHEEAMGTTGTGRNASGHIITAPEMVAENGSR